MQPRGHGSQNKAAFSDQRNTLCSSAAASGDQRNTTFMAFSDKRTRTAALMMQTEAILKDRTQHTSKKIRNCVIDTKV